MTLTSYPRGIWLRGGVNGPDKNHLMTQVNDETLFFYPLTGDGMAGIVGAA
jgi:hypothetical protein